MSCAALARHTFVLRHAVVLVLAGAFSAVLGGSAMADTAWDKAHPRRDQVNDRLANQTRRIDQERRAGDLTRAEAARLHRDDHRIRREERLMASMNGGHVTKAEQRALNQQENAVSRRIGQ